MPLLSTNRVAASRYTITLAAFLVSFLPAAQAATTNCSASSTSLSCRLTGLLHWLDAAAIVLVFILLAVIAVAIHVYRKNRADRPEHRRPESR